MVNSDNGEVFAVMEFLREGLDAPFHDEDEEIVNSYLVWGEVAIHYADLYASVTRQKDLGGFLLNIVRCEMGGLLSEKCLQIHTHF